MRFWRFSRGMRMTTIIYSPRKPTESNQHLMLVLTSIRSRKSRRVCEMSTYDSTDALARHILADKEGRCRRQHYGYR